MLEEQAASPFLACVKSPKSDAFPKVLMVMKSITFVAVGSPPPPKIPRVEEAHPPLAYLLVNKSPKSTAFPVDAIVIY